MSVAAIDIGSNSMRLLVLTDTGQELVRLVEVTGLGTGVDASGRFDEGRMQATLDVMAAFGGTIARLGVRRTAAVATSATRDADNGAVFASAVAERIGVLPDIITGSREAALSFAGATADREGDTFLVIDIGGGSTEFIRGGDLVEEAVSVDIGSVRLTDRLITDRPIPADVVAAAGEHVAALFEGVPDARGATVVGVAGTFTSLAAIVQGLPEYDRRAVDGSMLGREAVGRAVDQLAGLTIPETEAIPSLDPRRAPVIAAGSIIALCALDAVGTNEVIVSESDLLVGLARELLER